MATDRIWLIIAKKTQPKLGVGWGSWALLLPNFGEQARQREFSSARRIGGLAASEASVQLGRAVVDGVPRTTASTILDPWYRVAVLTGVDDECGPRIEAAAVDGRRCDLQQILRSVVVPLVSCDLMAVRDRDGRWQGMSQHVRQVPFDDVGLSRSDSLVAVDDGEDALEGCAESVVSFPCVAARSRQLASEIRDADVAEIGRHAPVRRDMVNPRRVETMRRSVLIEPTSKRELNDRIADERERFPSVFVGQWVTFARLAGDDDPDPVSRQVG